MDPFITVADLGARLKRDLTADASAAECVAAACDICRTVSEQDFSLVEDDVLTLDGTGTDVLLLPQLPVTEVSSVEVDDEAVTDFTVTDSGLLVHTESVWTKGRQNVVVTYSHGYATNEDVPSDVRIVALAVAARLMKSDDILWEGNEVAGTRLGVLPTDLSQGELRILHKHRR